MWRQLSLPWTVPSGSKRKPCSFHYHARYTISVNWQNVQKGDFLHNVYRAKGNPGEFRCALNLGTKIWIITEADRSVTTVLLPEEY